jgi:general secretion pathway protein N
MTRLLSLLCALSIVTIVVEVLHPPGVRGHPGGQSIAAAPSVVANPRSTSPAAASLDQWTKVVLGRPLFAPNRKPSGEALTAGVGLPRLAGIIASPDAAVAIFQPAGSVRPVVARHGDSIAGWEVTAVAIDAVSLQKANDRVILRPSFTGAEPGGGAAAEPKQPRTRWEAAAATGMLRARWSNPQLQP